MGFTQPICGQCWFAEHPKGPQPHRMYDPQVEQCCMCGQETIAGIYIRRAPSACYFPS